MMLCLSRKVGFLVLKPIFENRFLSLLRSKPPFHPEMSRPTKVTMTEPFLSPVLLFNMKTMKKEAFFFEKSHCKV